MTRFRVLDVLRLIAALGVILFHVAANTWGWSSKLFLMVDLFFVLSGFVLAPVFPKYKEFASLKKFLLKRFLRLAPSVWITIVFVFVYAVSLEIKHNLSDDMTMNSMQIDLQSIVLSLLLLQVFSSEATLLNYPLWSLSAEWIVNVVMAILAVILSRSFYIYILIVFLLLGIISASSPSDPEWVNQICRAGFGISLGMLIRHFFDQGINLQAQKLHLTLSSISSLIVVFLKIDFGSFQSIFSCLVFTYLIYSVANFEVEKNIRVPESLARNCGIYSFGLYVWHVPLSGLVNRLLEVVQLNDLGIFYLVLVATSSMATLISVNYIESPILQKLEVRLKTK